MSVVPVHRIKYVRDRLCDGVEVIPFVPATSPCRILEVEKHRLEVTFRKKPAIHIRYTHQTTKEFAVQFLGQPSAPIPAKACSQEDVGHI